VPGRRAGIGQILLHDVEAAVEEVRHIKQLGLTGGVLLPGVAPTANCAALLRVYEPLWRACAELDVVVTTTAVAACRSFRIEPIDRAILLVELPIFSHRAPLAPDLRRVFERHPSLKFVLTEQAPDGFPAGCAASTGSTARMRRAGATREPVRGETAAKMSSTPSEYFAALLQSAPASCARSSCTVRHEIGVEPIMWGSDYRAH